MKRISLICLALLWANTSLAQEVEPRDLDSVLSEQKAAVEREVKLKAEREKILGDITGLNQQLGSQIKTLSNLGADINTARSRFAQLDEDYKIQKTALDEDEKNLSQFLGYIQRIERRQPSPALTSPQSALKASQTALLIKSLTREFDQRSQQLEIQINDIARLREALVTEQAALEQKQTRIKNEEARLKTLVTQRRQKAASIADEEKKARQDAARLAAKAADLKELLEALEKANNNIAPRVKPRNSGGSPAPERRFSQNSGTKRFSQAKRSLLPPVAGRLIRKFGGSEQGITLAASSRSDVKAPYSGRVEFAGPFKNYENLVILNVGEGYFLLLTGLAEIIVDVGDNLSRGDIVGALPASRTDDVEIYVELRKGSGPVDPRPWFDGL